MIAVDLVITHDPLVIISAGGRSLVLVLVLELVAGY